MATVEVGAEAGGLHPGVSHDRWRVRRSGDDAALPRGRASVVCCAVVLAVDATVRFLRSRAQGPHQAVRAARVHHGRRGVAAAVSALHAWRDRQRGPAAQRQPRNAAEQRAGGADPQGGDEPRGVGARNARGEGAREIRLSVGGVRQCHQGGHLRGPRAARAIVEAGALPHDKRCPLAHDKRCALAHDKRCALAHDNRCALAHDQGCVRRRWRALAGGLPRGHAAGPVGDLLPDGRQFRAHHVEPEAGGGEGARHRGAAAGGSRRFVLDVGAARVRWQAAQVIEPG